MNSTRPSDHLRQILRAKFALFALGVLVSAACTGDATPAEPEPIPTDVSCLTGVERVDDLPDGYMSVLNAVALPTGVLQATQTPNRDGYGAKSGLLIKAGTSFRISVAAGQEDKALIGWGSGEGQQFEGRGCGDSGWIALVGGYEVEEPRCLALVVTDGNASVEFEVGVGVSC